MIRLMYKDRYRLYDSKLNKVYYPDFWIRHNNKIIIVEYYGYMTYQNGTFSNDIGYDSKHDNKVEYYMNRLDRDIFDYIGIYPKDIKVDNGMGLINKFKDIGIDIVL